MFKIGFFHSTFNSSHSSAFRRNATPWLCSTRRLPQLLSAAAAAAVNDIQLGTETSPQHGILQNWIFSHYHMSPLSNHTIGYPIAQDVETVEGRQFCSSTSFARRVSSLVKGIWLRVLISRAASDAYSGMRLASSRSSSSDEKPHETQASTSQSMASDSEDYVVAGKYCILLTGHASDYCQKLYGGYGQMFIKLLGDPQETWDVYAVVDGEFPPDEKLEIYDGFVVTGSRHSAHGTEEWISKLCDLLLLFHKRKQKTLGVCFGHQALGRALGGRTGKADVGWELGLRMVQTTDALASKSYAVGIPSVLGVFQVHQDQIQKVPPGAEILGFSERTGIEMFAVGNHVLGMQGHPEFTEDILTELIDSRLAAGILKDEDAKAGKASLKAGKADQDSLVQLCKRFLKRKS